MYHVELTADAERDLAQLDRQVAQRLFKRLEWLEANFTHITPEPLKGSLADLYKFRVGNYRVLYDIYPDDQVLLVHRVRHRSEVYKEK